jgi:predicted alpha-1,6-mannanase (GH76 family)
MQSRFLVYLNGARWIFPVFLFALCVACPAAAQWTTADEQTAFNDYNNAFYFNPSGDNYDYRSEQGSTSTSGFWVGAEEIELALDAYDQNPTSANATIINQLCNGFITQFSSDWSGDTYDDDLMWATIAFIRAYKATGNSTWLTDAENNFATVWSRGYDTTYGGGIWWNAGDKTYKASASNWTFVIAGNLLYQATGDSTYQSEAQTVYTWAYSTLYNSSTGEVYDGYGSGGLSTGQYSYNYGVSVAADYFENHPADANNAATYLMNNLSSGNVGVINIMPNYGQGGTDGSGFNSIALRWIGYAYSHGAITNANVLYWAQANVGLAWALQNSAGLSWNNWLAATPETAQYSWDCSNTLAGMLDIPTTLSSTSDFSLTASPATLPLNPGKNGSSTIRLTPAGSFSGAVSLTATVIGAPAGITATLSNSSIEDSGAVRLDVSTTSAVQGGNYVVAIVASGAGITHTVFVRLELPFFTLAQSPTLSYLNESGTATSTITITPHNDFHGAVQLAHVNGLPEGVGAWFRPEAATTTSTLTLGALASAQTILNSSYSVTGSSASYTQTLPAATLTVSAATAQYGAGIPVDLSSAYNVTGIYADGSTYSTSAGLDGLGYSFSSKLLSRSRVLDHTLFKFGPAAHPDAVYGTGTAIPLPRGQYTGLRLLATGINGNQTAQTVVVTYTDGTTSQFTQSFSDWFAVAYNANEAEGVAMPYRNYADGTANDAPFNLYGNTFLLNPDKSVQSVTLPNNRNVVVLAATLIRQDFGVQANLSSLFNATGIYTDGSTFASNGGIDGGGYAYSATELGNQAGPSDYIVNGVNFKLGGPNVNNVLYGTGRPIPLPRGHFSTLRILGTGIEGGASAQPVIVTYTDGTTRTFTQGFSDWFGPQGYPREFKAQTQTYRNQSSGSTSSATFYLYYYAFPLEEQKVVQSITLPSNRNVVAMAITLTREFPD